MLEENYGSSPFAAVSGRLERGASPSPAAHPVLTSPWVATETEELRKREEAAAVRSYDPARRVSVRASCFIQTAAFAEGCFGEIKKHWALHWLCLFQTFLGTYKKKKTFIWSVTPIHKKKKSQSVGMIVGMFWNQYWYRISCRHHRFFRNRQGPELKPFWQPNVLL